MGREACLNCLLAFNLIFRQGDGILIGRVFNRIDAIFDGVSDIVGGVFKVVVVATGDEKASTRECENCEEKVCDFFEFHKDTVVFGKDSRQAMGRMAESIE